MQVNLSFGSILALIFITLKLTGYLTWSWLWVLSPLWIGLAVMLVMFIIVFVVAFIKG